MAVKGERLCASLALPRDALPALVPLLRSFPLITWKTDANSSAGGESLVLCDTKENDAPLLSLFVLRAGAGAELEVLGARTPSPRQAPTLGEEDFKRFAARVEVGVLESGEHLALAALHCIARALVDRPLNGSHTLSR